ncbi:MAG: hypothetical protein R3F51_09175 [Cyanobacteriota/Melainabacteria group bacterium]
MASTRPSSPMPEELLDAAALAKRPLRVEELDSRSIEKDSEASKDTQDTQESQESQETKESRESRDSKNDLDFRPAKETKDAPDVDAPSVEIVEDTSLQIRDESGKVIAASGDAILNISIERDATSGNIASISYPDGRIRNFSHDGSQLKSIETLTPTRNGKFSQTSLVHERGRWHAEINGMKAALPGRVRLADNGEISFELDGKGKWRHEKPDGTILMEKATASGARLIFDEKDNINKITRVDGSAFEGRYIDGDLVGITETDRYGNKTTWRKVGNRWLSDQEPPQERREFRIYANGNVGFIDNQGEEHVTTVTGKSLSVSTENSRFRVDEEGRFTSVETGAGQYIEALKYNDNGHVVYGRENGDQGKILHYARQDGGDTWSLTITDDSGNVEEMKEWQGDISVTDGGEYVCRSSSALSNLKTADLFKADDLKEMEHPLDKIDFTEEELNRPILEVNKYGFSERVVESRERLTELMEGHLDEPQKKRFQIILDRFELRGKNRIEAQVAAGQSPDACQQEWDEKITKSYENLTKMLDGSAPNATYDLNVRAKLVEAMAFSMACPVKANDQGNWGCCWMISGVFAGIIQYPDKMTDMLAQLSNTGQYTDLEGQTWTPPKGLLSITSQGGRWTIENCGGGHRSPVSEILTSVAAYLSADGRRTDRGASGGTASACNHAMKKITGDTWTVTSERDMVTPKMRQEMLEKGGYICIYPGHMYLAALEKHGEEWLVCASLQHGDGGRRINGTVSDLQSWTITGGRRRYNPDIDLPECQDSPTGSIGNDWPGGGGRFNDWDYPFPWGPDPWPLNSITFALRLYDESDRKRRILQQKEEEELKKQKEKERLEEERLIAEEKERERLERVEQELEDRRVEERLRREKIDREREKKKQEELKKLKIEAAMKDEERYRKYKSMDEARGIAAARAYNQRGRNTGGQPTDARERSLSEQILDQQNIRPTVSDDDQRTPSWSSIDQSASQSAARNAGPIWVNGIRLSQSVENHIEPVSPVEGISPELKATLEEQSNPNTGSSS